MKIYTPLAAGHPAVTEGHLCALCHERFRAGDRVGLVPLPDPEGHGYSIRQDGKTVPACIVHAACLRAIERVRVEFESACPDCASTLFHPGPCGGAAHNIMCAGCGSKFWFCPPFTPERIQNESEFYDMTVRKTVWQILEPPQQERRQ